MTAPSTETADNAPQNLFGICARVGEDFGFNPLWLRLGFAAALILDPVAVIAAYFALGGLVLLSRMIFPNRRPSADTAPLVLVADNPDGAVVEKADELPLAA